jgi:RNA polymerase sigma factor (sigma-70 family)
MSESFVQDDKALWRSLKNGDDKALASIYKLHVKELHRYGMRFSLDESQISDCLHDVFVEIWQKRNELTQDINSIRFYLIKSLRNRVLRYLTNQKRMVLTDDVTPYHFDFEQAHDVDLIKDEETQQRSTKLNQAISTLSTRQREALFLRFNQNLSYEEVAQIMGVEQQSAYNLIFRAVEALRKHYGHTTFWLLMLNVHFGWNISPLTKFIFKYF